MDVEEVAEMDSLQIQVSLNRLRNPLNVEAAEAVRHCLMLISSDWTIALMEQSEITDRGPTQRQTLHKRKRPVNISPILCVYDQSQYSEELTSGECISVRQFRKEKLENLIRDKELKSA
jgi:hypothetical protein